MGETVCEEKPEVRVVSDDARAAARRSRSSDFTLRSPSVSLPSRWLSLAPP